jgi:glycine cleavage system H protein
MSYPADLLYTEDHEWVRIEGNVATVGITSYATTELGDIVYVEVETVDETLDHAVVFGSVEAVKTVSDLFMPLPGKVIEFNEELNDTPEIVNEDPYGKGWMIKVEIADDVDVSHLLKMEAYKKSVSV